ncbi:ubiquinone biosynthesis protein COQ7-domain-containing protein [Chaetomium strumarium]|uniref:5-demethoxyubiquinone hydroxylase, mitochondrial n=1 Tax=Chaetomium strumarium TaxID=1170767 RepID=A0AAJ0M1B9_9PEZI|nr:ubiquinone biosynthesis protein COQ7-domain-containing protein [Chaetomium strumarium]
MVPPRPGWTPLRLCRPRRLAPHTTTPAPARLISSTTSASQAADGFPTSSSSSPSSSGNPQPPNKPQPPKPKKPLTPEQQSFLSSALRVNQAGELAATLIYRAQTPVVVGREPHLRPLMQHMYDQEVGHFRTFNELIAKHRVRPTALYPLWSVLATGLGWTTGVLGREAAMACTEAVETEIGGHYNAQIRRLLEMVGEWEAEGYDVGDEFRELISTLRRIRDEELEHLDHAVEHDAKKAEPHWLLTGVIRAGCRGAIWVSERV